MYRRTTTRSGSAPEAPDLQGDGYVFRSRAELLEALRRVASRPGQVHSADIRTERDVSRHLGDAARLIGGGVVWLRPVTDEAGRHLDRWLAARAPEHAPDALDGPYKARVAGEPEGLVVGVAEGKPPTFWEDLDPDRWPVDAPLSSIDRALLAKLCARQTFSPNEDARRSWDNEADLLALDAGRLVRGFVHATLAGWVALSGWSLSDPQGMRLAIRMQDGSVWKTRGHRRRMVADALHETSWWAGLPPGAAALALHFALAERAWGGPDAAKPITLSRDGARLRLSVPTTPANRRERESEGPANPLLRRFLMALGDLPGWDEDVGVADNPLVLESLRGYGVEATMQELGGETRVELWAGVLGRGAGSGARVTAQAGPEADRGSRLGPASAGSGQSARGSAIGSGAGPGHGPPTMLESSAVDPAQGVRAQPSNRGSVSSQGTSADSASSQAGWERGASTHGASSGAGRDARAQQRSASTGPGRGSESRAAPSPADAQARRGGSSSSSSLPQKDAATSRRGSAVVAAPHEADPGRQKAPASAARGDQVANQSARDDGQALSAARSAHADGGQAAPFATPDEHWSPERPPKPPAGQPRTSRLTAAARDLQPTSAFASRAAPSALQDAARSPLDNAADDGSSRWAPPAPDPRDDAHASPAAPSPALNLEDRKAQILDLLSANPRPLSLKEIAEALKVQRDTPRKALAALVADGLLELTDPNPRSPQQRYRLV